MRRCHLKKPLMTVFFFHPKCTFLFFNTLCIVDSSCKKTTGHLQQHFFNILEPNKGTKGA
jgi:hypothetical protein